MGPFAGGVASLLIAAGALAGCSEPAPAPVGPVSTAGAGKAAFNESKAIEKIYHAGYTGISNLTPGPDGAWRGQATRKGSRTPVAISVTESGPVVARVKGGKRRASEGAAKEIDNKSRGPGRRSRPGPGACSTGWGACSARAC